VSQSREGTEQSFHRHIYAVLQRFLKVNSQFLQNFEEGKLLNEANGTSSLENVLDLVKDSGHKLFVG